MIVREFVWERVGARHWRVTRRAAVDRGIYETAYGRWMAQQATNMPLNALGAQQASPELMARIAGYNDFQRQVWQEFYEGVAKLKHELDDRE